MGTFKLSNRLIKLWAIGATIVSISLIVYNTKIKYDYKAYMGNGRAVMSNCIEKSKVANALSGNCAKAYNLTAKCMTNLYQCDMETEKQKLRILNEEKIELEKVMNRLSEKTTELLNQN